MPHTSVLLCDGIRLWPGRQGLTVSHTALSTGQALAYRRTNAVPIIPAARIVHHGITQPLASTNRRPLPESAQCPALSTRFCMKQAGIGTAFAAMDCWPAPSVRSFSRSGATPALGVWRLPTSSNSSGKFFTTACRYPAIGALLQSQQFGVNACGSSAPDFRSTFEHGRLAL